MTSEYYRLQIAAISPFIGFCPAYIDSRYKRPKVLA